MKFTEQKIANTLETNYMPYAMSVIVSRAIPEIDGFKPSHRKLLYTMYKMGLINGNRTKSANIVGQTMHLNPHGDAAIYETMVRLTKGNEALLHPFVDSKGNFGKQYSRDMFFAASRYTEAKLSDICKEIFLDIEKNPVDFQDNYDATCKEPVLLPVSFPNILVNANEGIAVGMASKICSFNLKEVCETTIGLINDENHDILSTLKAPDFPGGGELLYNEEEMREIYNNGRGSFKVRGKYSYDKKNSIIEITQIPYSTTSEIIIDKVVESIKAGKYKEINDIRDETDLSGLRIAIDVKRSADIDKLMAKLFKDTTLQDTFSCNFNILINGAPRVMGVKEIISEWIKFRVKCISRTLEFERDRKAEKLHKLKGLEKILLDIDKAIKIIRETEKDADVIPSLMSGFDIDEIQANYVAEIKLRNLNKEYILKNIKDIADLEREIEEINKTLSSEKRIKKVIVKQLEDVIKKYGVERKTEIVSASDSKFDDYSPESEIEDYPVKMFLTEQGYLKKITLNSLRMADKQKLKEDDEIKRELDANNKDDLLLFSNKCNCYKLRINDIKDTKASLMGDFIPNIVAMEEGERVVFIHVTGDYSGKFLFGFADGRTCKTSAKTYETKTNRKMLQKAFSDHSPIVDIVFLTEDIDVVAFGSNEKAFAFNTAVIPEKATRSSRGVLTFKTGKTGKMVALKTLEATNIADSKPYRARKIPSAGAKLTAEDKGIEQLSF